MPDKKLRTQKNEDAFRRSIERLFPTSSNNYNIKRFVRYMCSVANVHVTHALSVDWMVQPNHGQQAIFQSAYSHKQYTYTRY